MQYLKQSTAVEVVIGPAVAVGDGFTPVTTLTISAADEKHIIKHEATGGALIAGTLAVFSTAAVDGYYTLDLSTTDTNTIGMLTLVIQDDSLILPIRHEYMVLATNVYDSLFGAATDKLQVDVIQQVGGTVPTPTTTGVPDVNVERWLDTLVTLSASTPDVNVQSMDAASIASGVVAAAELNNITDNLLKRDWDGLTGEAARSCLNALRFLRNKWSISGTTLTVTKEDDTASAWTSTLVTDATADPITSSDPV